MTLRDLISAYRKDHGLSQRQFANQCGLSNGYISMLEKGINPTKRELGEHGTIEMVGSVFVLFYSLPKIRK